MENGEYGEWEDYYYAKVYSKEHLEHIGRRLYTKRKLRLVDSVVCFA